MLWPPLKVAPAPRTLGFASSETDFFEAKASEIFDMFLGEPDYLSVLEAAGVGYGKITLGE